MSIVAMPAVLSADSVRLGSGVRIALDGAKAKAQLGFEPRSLDESLREIMRDELTRRNKPLPAQLTGQR